MKGKIVISANHPILSLQRCESDFLTSDYYHVSRKHDFLYNYLLILNIDSKGLHGSTWKKITFSFSGMCTSKVLDLVHLHLRCWIFLTRSNDRAQTLSLSVRASERAAFQVAETSSVWKSFPSMVSCDCGKIFFFVFCSQHEGISDAISNPPYWARCIFKEKKRENNELLELCWPLQ